MNNHTPGPWGIETVKTSCGHCHKVGPFPWRDDEANHACIYVDDSHAWVNGKELEANARLIAASPDLLDALEALIPLVEWALKEQSPPYFDGPLVVQSCVAIAKAKGETT